MNFLRRIFFQNTHLITASWSISDVPQWDEKRSWYCKRSWRTREVIAEDCQTCWTIWTISSGLSMLQRLTVTNKNVLCNLWPPWEVHSAAFVCVTFELPDSGPDKEQWCWLVLVGTVFRVVLVQKGLHYSILEETAKPMYFAILYLTLIIQLC